MTTINSIYYSAFKEGDGRYCWWAQALAMPEEDASLVEKFESRGEAQSQVRDWKSKPLRRKDLIKHREE